MDHIRNLVFEGGGVKGIAYLGALKELQQQGILQQCSRFCGNSAGSITAWLSTYYKEDLNALEDLQRKTNFSQFADDSIGVVRDAHRLLDRYGWHKGDAFYEWAQDITLKRFGKRNISFRELYEETGLELTLTACNVSKAKTVWFSKDVTPDFFVESALRMSMSIPIYFRGIFISDRDVNEAGEIIGNPGIDKDYEKNRDLFVDGGVLDNYPIQAFDTPIAKANRKGGELIEDVTNRKNPIYNKSTLGLRVDSSHELQFDRGLAPEGDDFYESKNFFNYLKNLIDLIHSNANKRHLDDYDWHRTVRIDTGTTKSTNFDLTKEEQDALVLAGKQAVIDYLQKDRAGYRNNP